MTMQLVQVEKGQLATAQAGSARPRAECGREIISVKSLLEWAFEARRRHGGAVSDAELEWLVSRDEARCKCEQITALAEGDAA